VEDNCCGLKASVRIIGTRTYIWTQVSHSTKPISMSDVHLRN
jgi:hypothetical protein